jgi:hypothetical protein
VNEVRDIVARMLEEPAPPPRSPDEVLRIARRANRRRSLLAAAASGSLVLLLVVGVGVAVRSLHPPTAPPVTEVAGPVGRTTPSHGEVMAQRIVAWLPDGLTALTVETFSDATERVPVAADVQVLAAAVVQVGDGDGYGEIFAYIAADGGTGDSLTCEDIGVAPPDGCRLESVNDVVVRVVTSTHRLRGQHAEVTRLVPGGRLVVGAWQTALGVEQRAPEGGRTWLVVPLRKPVDPRVLTALAADPAMLPT